MKKRKILFFLFSHEACMISERGSQIFTLEKPSTKLRFARVGTSTSAVWQISWWWECDAWQKLPCGMPRWRCTELEFVLQWFEFSPVPEHHSRCSIFTLGGFRKVLFFFSLCFFPLAWKFLQLSTRPSRVSWQTVHTKKKRDLDGQNLFWLSLMVT